MPKTAINDSSLFYEVRGKGSPLLLIAGLGSDSSSWLGVIKNFEGNFKTIAFDNRGCGRSDIGGREFSIALMAEDAVKLLDFLGVEKAHILGHSMGGYIAQEVAINYPERVDKLVLSSTAAVSSKRNCEFFYDMYCRLKEKGYSKDWYMRWVPWLFSAEAIADKNFIDSFIKNSLRYPYFQKAEGFKNQIDAIYSFDVRDKIASIKSKTLVLEGGDDRLITPEESGVMAMSIHGSEFKLLEDAAHAIQIETPKLFSAVVLDFL